MAARKDGKKKRARSDKGTGVSRTPQYRKNDSLKRRYGITLDDYNALFASQNYRCAICGCEEPDMKLNRGDGWCVDHCHETGKVRGILCPSCNLLLGRAKDSVTILESAIKYLEENYA